MNRQLSFRYAERFVISIKDGYLSMPIRRFSAYNVPKRVIEIADFS